MAKKKKKKKIKPVNRPSALEGCRTEGPIRIHASDYRPLEELHDTESESVEPPGLCGAFCHHVRGPSRPSPVSSMTRISAGGLCSGGRNGAPTMKPRHLLRTILPALTIGTATRPEGR